MLASVISGTPPPPGTCFFHFTSSAALCALSPVVETGAVLSDLLAGQVPGDYHLAYCQLTVGPLRRALRQPTGEAQLPRERGVKSVVKELRTARINRNPILNCVSARRGNTTILSFTLEHESLASIKSDVNILSDLSEISVSMNEHGFCIVIRVVPSSVIPHQDRTIVRALHASTPLSERSWLGGCMCCNDCTTATTSKTTTTATTTTPTTTTARITTVTATNANTTTSASANTDAHTHADTDTDTDTNANSSTI